MGNSVATVESFELAQRQARAFAGSALVPDVLKGSVENCLAAIMLADEMGESRLAVMQNIYFVKGRAAWISAYMVARANKSGKFVGPLRWRTLSHDPLAVECYADLRDAAKDDRRVSIVVDMKTADESGWTTYKKDGKTLTHARWATPVMQEQMLRWRSASWLIRLYDPECMMGLPTKEELEDISGEMIDVTPPMPNLSDFAPPATKGKTKEQNPEDGPPERSPSGVPQTPAAACPPAAASPDGERKPIAAGRGA